MLRRNLHHHTQPGHVGLRKEHLVWDATGTELRMLREQRVIARLSEATGGMVARECRGLDERSHCLAVQMDCAAGSRGRCAQDARQSDRSVIEVQRVHRQHRSPRKRPRHCGALIRRQRCCDQRR
jgi:hypothetical protein